MSEKVLDRWKVEPPGLGIVEWRIVRRRDGDGEIQNRKEGGEWITPCYGQRVAESLATRLLFWKDSTEKMARELGGHHESSH